MSERALSNTRTTDLFGHPTYHVSRDYLIKQGFLVDLTEHARAVGFNEADVCVTRAAYEDCIEWSGQDRTRWGKTLCLTQKFRLDTVLRNALSTRNRNLDRRQVFFTIVRPPRFYHHDNNKTQRLKLHIGREDGGRLVATIMLDHEQ